MVGGGTQRGCETIDIGHFVWSDTESISYTLCLVTACSCRVQTYGMGCAL